MRYWGIEASPILITNTLIFGLTETYQTLILRDLQNDTVSMYRNIKYLDPRIRDCRKMRAVQILGDSQSFQGTHYKVHRLTSVGSDDKKWFCLVPMFNQFISKPLHSSECLYYLLDEEGHKK